MLLSLLVAYGILVAYAIIGYVYVQYKYLAPVTAVAVTTTDFVIYLLMGANYARGPFEVSVLVILFRSLLFGFGSDMWFIGHCVLYIILGVYIFT